MREVYRLEVRGVDVFNEEDDKDIVAQGVVRINNPENLRRIIDSQETVLRSDLSDGTRLVIIHPTGRYTDRALMLSAYNEDAQPTNRDGNTRYSHFIEDYSDEAQKAWWDLVLSGLKAGRKILDEEGKWDVANKFVANVTHVSSLDTRTSRTIIFPHGQFVERDQGLLQIHELHHVPMHEAHEKGFILAQQPFFERMMGMVSREMKRSDVDAPELKFADDYPIGYEFYLPEDLETVVEVMRAHHKAYEVVNDRFKRSTISAGKIVKSEVLKANAMRIIDPPSYRLFVGLESDGLRINISPEFISHAGVMQAWGIHLVRDESFPLRVSEEQNRAYGDKFGELIKQESVLLNPALVTSRNHL